MLYDSWRQLLTAYRQTIICPQGYLSVSVNRDCVRPPHPGPSQAAGNFLTTARILLVRNRAGLLRGRLVFLAV
ncbi:hypothetical protein HYQ46_003177 [Verticillium longisporum]|nr:hypothetical protein HYQ46_003177 [Verticillium longisporum]